MENRKHIMDKFQEHLYASYISYCELHDISSSIPGFITFLIDHDLIPSTQIKRYTILKEFKTLFPKKQNHKTKTVHELAHRFNISERAVWSILKQLDSKQFFIKRNFVYSFPAVALGLVSRCRLLYFLQQKK